MSYLPINDTFCINFLLSTPYITCSGNANEADMVDMVYVHAMEMDWNEYHQMELYLIR